MRMIRYDIKGHIFKNSRIDWQWHSFYRTLYVELLKNYEKNHWPKSSDMMCEFLHNQSKKTVKFLNTAF